MIDFALAVALSSLTCSPIPAARAPYTDAQAERDLRAVIEAFRTAITRKDREAFLALFADAPILWQRVDSDARLARSRSLGKPEAKVTIETASGPRAFIDNIVSSSNKHEEVFNNIDIENDKDVASITFDFVYQVNDLPITAGKESWHVVRSERGWRITSVIYSRTNP